MTSSLQTERPTMEQQQSTTTKSTSKLSNADTSNNDSIHQNAVALAADFADQKPGCLKKSESWSSTSSCSTEASSPSPSVSSPDVCSEEGRPTLGKRRSSIIFNEAHIYEFEPTVWTTSVPSSGVPVGLSSKLRRRLRRRINSFEEERSGEYGRVERQEFMESGWLAAEDRLVILGKAGVKPHVVDQAEVEINRIIEERMESNEEDVFFEDELEDLEEEDSDESSHSLECSEGEERYSDVCGPGEGSPCSVLTSGVLSDSMLADTETKSGNGTRQEYSKDDREDYLRYLVNFDDEYEGVGPKLTEEFASNSSERSLV